MALGRCTRRVPPADISKDYVVAFFISGYSSHGKPNGVTFTYKLAAAIGSNGCDIPVVTCNLNK